MAYEPWLPSGEPKMNVLVLLARDISPLSSTRTLSVIPSRVSYFVWLMLIREGRAWKLSDHRGAVHFGYSIQLVGRSLLVVERVQTALATSYRADGRMGPVPISVASSTAREPRWGHGNRSLLLVL